MLLLRQLKAPFIAISAWILLPAKALAQNAPNLNDLSVPVIPGRDLITVLRNLLDDVLLWLGIAAFIFVLYGGFLYLTSGGDPARAEKGRNSIVYAIIGIMIIFASFALVRYVNRRLDSNASRATTTQTNPNNR
jgi:hypothetical protein